MPVDVSPGLEVSRADLFEDRIVQEEIRNNLLQSIVFLLKLFETLGLIDTQAAVFLSPAIERPNADAELFAHLRCAPSLA